MQEKRIRDIMIPLSNYAVVHENAPLRDAVVTLRRSHCELETGLCTEAGPRSVLVVDDSGRLVGILDFRAILKVLIPEVAGGLTEKLEALGVAVALAEGDAAPLDEAHAGFYARVRQNAQVRVKDIMLKVKGTIDADDNLLKALKLMFKNKITKLPVHEAENLVGVVRDTDLFLAVADILAEA